MYLYFLESPAMADNEWSMQTRGRKRSPKKPPAPDHDESSQDSIQSTSSRSSSKSNASSIYTASSCSAASPSAPTTAPTTAPISAPTTAPTTQLPSILSALFTNCPPPPLSSTAPTSMPTSMPTPAPMSAITTYAIDNLPKHAQTPKGIHPYLTRIRNLSILNVSSTRHGAILIKSSDPEAGSKLRTLRNIIGLEVTISSKTLSPAPRFIPRKPTFSCVITGVDLDITVDEVKAELTASSLLFTNVWRIKSRANDQLTRLVRVVTDHQSTLDRLLSAGFFLFSSHHRVEPSRPPPAQPNQCYVCQEFHAPGVCKKPVVCGLCTQNHPTRACTTPQESHKCATCAGNHPTMAAKCPQRPKEAVSLEKAAPLRIVEYEEAEKKDAPATTPHAPIIKFLTAALLTAFPAQREQLTSHLAGLTASIFNSKLLISYSGSRIHIFLHPLG